MKAYKGFHRDMTCKGFQFEEGKTYECEEAKLCEKGFHACLDPLDCYRYYSPGVSAYHEVEIEEVSDERENDSKVVCRKITIGKELTTDEMHDIHLEIVGEKFVKIGYSSSVRAGIDSSVNAGIDSSVNAGDYSSVKAGNWSSVKAGNWSSVRAGSLSSVRAGINSSVNAGDLSSVMAGDYSSVKAGDWSSVNAGSLSSARAGNASVIYSYANSRYCGGKNSVFACAYGGKVYTAIVDGEKILPDVWYVFRDGKFVMEDEV